MIKDKYNVIGVMSGTSLDGIDIVYATYCFDKSWKFEIHDADTFPYSERWKKMLSDLPNETMPFLRKIDKDFTVLLAEKIEVFIDINNIKDIDFIASHGHTALHQPKNKLTYQIGNLPDFADILNRKVVCDFRVQDVELGGQGAPLVPIGDLLLFSDYAYCLNLGGFANISTDINNERIAYDICPVNIVLNYYMSQIGKDFDDKGQLASTGKIHEPLLDKLNALHFYHSDYPKSLGYEWVKEHIFPLIASYKLDLNDILRTFIAHCAYQISKEINKKDHAKVLITGGGAYNDFLISEIKTMTKNTLVLPEKILIEYKEALIFGLLGVLKIRNEVNCLASVTGASRDHSSGKIFEP